MANIIQDKLAKLRRKLTGWLLVHGLGRWLVTGLVVVACSIILDRIFKMDLAQRSIVLLAMTGTGIAYFYWLVVRRLMKRAGDDALILEVEKKHPDLRENLISSWQLARQSIRGELAIAGTSESMAQATIASGLTKAESIDFIAALDHKEHTKDWTVLGAGLFVAFLLCIGIWQTSFLRTWFQRNVLLANVSWPQSTYLEIVGAKEGRLLIPRGADHRQLVLVTENSAVREVKITLELDLPANRNVQQMRSTGRLSGREYASVIYNVSSPFRMRAIGGDDVTDWVEVDLVEPPTVMEMKLTARLPSYTQVEVLELSGSGPHTILDGSSLDLEVDVNKPLQQALLKRGPASSENETETYPLEQLSQDKFGLRLNSDQLRGGEYSLVLIDESGLQNVRPTKFSVTLKEDQPPRLRASLLGISGMVVPQASLPTSYHAVDEYGLQRLYFETRWTAGQAEGAEESPPAQREVTITEFPTNATLTREVKDYAVLDLRPLQLQPGGSLRFCVAAADIFPQPVGIGRSQEFLLRVVTNEELRADLLRREIEQRKAFEQAYERQMELSAELQMIAMKRPADRQSPEQFRNQLELELIALVRNQKGIGTWIAQVADRFEEFLVEIKNNRLDEAETELFPGQSTESRFDAGIIQPIRRLDQELITLATRNMDHCRTLLTSNAQLLEATEQTAVIHQEILAEMRKILNAMNDSENFQEIINDLLRIKDEQQGLINEIEKQSKSKDIFDQPDDDIFDK
jgi:hypothetical protein